jgi:16S rRNA processing protein RimM
MPTGRNAGRIVLKLAGCDSINDAERLAHMKLMLPATERPALDEDTFYVSDLVGSTLYNREAPDRDVAVGTVVDIEFATSPDGKTRLADAAPLLAIRLTGTPDDAEPSLVPFVRAQLISVDTAARRITMQLPPGLLDPTT